MAPWGSITPLIGNNPIACAIPAGKEDPIVLGMSLSTVARAKILQTINEGQESIPEGWALDKEGRATTDAKVAKDGLLIPIGDHKGSGLSIAFFFICAGLTGANWDN